MIHGSDADVDRVLDADAVLAVLERAFIDFAQGKAAMQARIRTDAGGVKLSTLGAVIPGQRFAGAKVYTTIGGRFSFVIVLFDAESGAPVATFDAAALTRWRTAAVSVLAGRCAGAPLGGPLAIFGTGVQARAHLEAFARAFRPRELRIVSRGDGQALLARAHELGLSARLLPARAALDGAALVVTATRTSTPLFDGGWLQPGAFIAAVGSSRPDTRELDDRALGRARAVVVEWREQTLSEAGDLLLADPAVRAGLPVLELGELLAATGTIPAPGSRDLTIFKSVGVGLEDIAVAGLAYQRLTGSGTG